MSMNVCVFVGNMVSDVVIKDVNGGKVGTFSIAVSRKYKKADGTMEKETSFFDLEAWGKQAESIDTYFKKGNPIGVTCSAKQENWVDKATSQKRSKIKFRVEGFSFLPSGGQKEKKPDEDDNDNRNQNQDNDTPF